MNIRTSTGTDHDGDYVQAKAKGITAVYHGGPYIELLFGDVPFDAIGTEGDADRGLTPEYVASELEKYLDQTSAYELREQRIAVGL